VETRVTGIRELFRYTKARRTRSYGLKRLDEARSELWVVAAERGRTRSRKLVTLTHEEMAIVLESIEQELRLGGWALMP